MTYLDPVRDELARQLPGLDEGLLDLYTLLAFVKGRHVTCEDVHDAWSVWMRRRNPGHRSLQLFDDLDADVQAKDDLYVQAIKKAVA